MSQLNFWIWVFNLFFKPEPLPYTWPLRALWGWWWRAGWGRKPPAPGPSRSSLGPGWSSETAGPRQGRSMPRGRCCGPELHRAGLSPQGGCARFLRANGPGWTDGCRNKKDGKLDTNMCILLFGSSRLVQFLSVPNVEKNQIFYIKHFNTFSNSKDHVVKLISVISKLILII